MNISSSIASLTESAISSSLCCSWKELAALVSSVAGVAISLFVQSIFGVLGFSLFGLTILIGHFENLHTVSEIESNLTQALRKQGNEAITAANAFNRNIRDLTNENARWEADIQMLVKYNANSEEILNRSEQEAALIGKSDETIVKTSTSLEQSLNVARVDMNEMQSELKTFMSETLKLGETSGAFRKNAETLDVAKARLQQELNNFDQETNVDMTKLVTQLKVVNEAAKNINRVLSQSAHALETGLSSFQSEVNDLHVVDQQIQHNLTALETMHSQLNELNRDIEKKQNLQSSLDQELKKRTEELEQNFQRVNEQKKEMEGVLGKLEEACCLKSNLLKSLDEEITHRFEKLNLIRS